MCGSGKVFCFIGKRFISWMLVHIRVCIGEVYLFTEVTFSRQRRHFFYTYNIVHGSPVQYFCTSIGKCGIDLKENVRDGKQQGAC